METPLNPAIPAEEEVPATLGKRIFMARQVRGLSTKKLAEMLSTDGKEPLNWLVIRRLEEDGMTKNGGAEFMKTYGDGLAKALDADLYWLENGKREHEAVAPVVAPEPVSAPRVLPNLEAEKPKPQKATGPKLGATHIFGAAHHRLREPEPESEGHIARQKRLAMGISQDELGLRVRRQIGQPVNGQHISAYELNKSPPALPLHIRKAIRDYYVDHYLQLQHPEKAEQMTPAKTPSKYAKPKLTDYAGAGARLQVLRRKSGLTQKDISDLIHCQHFHISLLECNKHTYIPTERVVDLATLFGVSEEYILFGEHPARGAPRAAEKPVALTATSVAAMGNMASKEAAVPVTPPPPAPVPPPVAAKVSPPVRRTANNASDTDTMIRVRTVGGVSVEADEMGFYFFFTRRAFRNEDGKMKPVTEAVTNLSMTPELAKAMRNTLDRAIKGYEAALGPITE